VSQYAYLLMDRALFIVSAVCFIGVLVVAQQVVRGLRRGFTIRSQLSLVLALSTLVLSSLLTGVLLIGESDGIPLLNLMPQVAFVVLALTGAAAVSAIVVARTVARPIERLTQASLRVAAGERQAALPLPRGKEVRELTQAFESMRRELEERDALEALASDLMHELKNPVAAIRASAEVLDDAIGEDPEAARRFSRRILEAADRLDMLCSDLLDLTRLEARGLAEPDASVDLGAVLADARAALLPLAQTAEVELRLEAPSVALACGDARWLQVAVENLLANAVHFAPRASQVRLGLASRDRAWEISVVDAGPGVEPSMRERLFERFVGSRHGEGGTGLGLAIVRAVAEAHGGEARLQDSSASGSHFVISLPRCD
jgi:two-component system sensor histidine kinase CreC